MFYQHWISAVSPFFLPVLFSNRLPALLSALDFLAHLDLSLHTLQFLLGIDQTKMRVGIQGNTDIRMVSSADSVRA